MITDVLYSVNLYILFCVKHFELSHVMDIALQKCYVLLLLLFISALQYCNRNYVHLAVCPALLLLWWGCCCCCMIYISTIGMTLAPALRSLTRNSLYHIVLVEQIQQQKSQDINWNNLKQEIVARQQKVLRHKSITAPKTSSAPPMSADAIPKIGSCQYIVLIAHTKIKIRIWVFIPSEGLDTKSTPP